MLEYQLLSPEEDSKETYPYRRVWRPLLSELGVLLLVGVVLLVATISGIMADTHNQSVQLGIAILPIIAFLWFSARVERQVFRPRPHLISVMVLSGVLANGLAVPLIEQVYTPAIWLPEAGFFNRIFGYMATEGILAASLMYGIVRYTVWQNHFRLRLDGVAYCAAAAVGYATVFNVHLVLNEELMLSAAIIRIISQFYLTMIVAVVVGYFLGEFAIGRPAFFWMPLGLGVAAFIYGVYMAFRAIAVRSGLNVGASASRPLGPLFLAIGFTAVLLWVIAFLIESADERMAHREGMQRIR